MSGGWRGELRCAWAGVAWMDASVGQGRCLRSIAASAPAAPSAIAAELPAPALPPPQLQLPWTSFALVVFVPLLLFGLNVWWFSKILRGALKLLLTSTADKVRRALWALAPGPLLSCVHACAPTWGPGLRPSSTHAWQRRRSGVLELSMP